MWIVDEVLAGCGGALEGHPNRNRAFGGFSIDSRTIAPGEIFIALSGPHFDGHDYVEEAARKQGTGAIVSRKAFGQRATRWQAWGETFSLILVDDPLTALQALAAWHRTRFTMPLIGITGSNGKTTTKEMCATILEQQGPILKNEGNLNNHIGLPLTLLKLAQEHRAAVLEMGINKKGEMKPLCDIAKPTVGLITNIGAAHLEGLGDLAGVAKEKTVLFEAVKKEGTAVINRDDPYLQNWTGRVPKAWTFGLDPEADLCAKEIVEDAGVLQFTLRRTRPENGSIRVRLPLPGRHQISNALGAAAVAAGLGFGLVEIRDGLAHVEAPAQRMEIVKRQDFTLLFDVYNANPDSMIAALKVLAAYPADRGPRIAVLGEMLELGPASRAAHADIGRTVAELGIDRLIAVGPSAADTAQGAREGGMAETALSSHTDLDGAASALRPQLKAGSTLLLKGSRGMRMEKLVEALPDVL